MILIDPFQLGIFSDAMTKGSEHLAAAVLFQQPSPAALFVPVGTWLCPLWQGDLNPTFTHRTWLRAYVLTAANCREITAHGANHCAPLGLSFFGVKLGKGSCWLLFLASSLKPRHPAPRRAALRAHPARLSVALKRVSTASCRAT